ncbi:MAG: ABC transporter ATP-binding protein [Candidatus Dormibacteria bacterium]
MSASLAAELLPTASARQVWRSAGGLLRPERGTSAWVLALQAAATLAGLVGPWALGTVVQAAADHRLSRVLGPVVAIFIVATLLRTALTVAAGRRAGRLGARVLTRLREQFLGNVLSLPLGVVERAGTGDLLTRATSDVDSLAEVVQHALPEIAIALATMALTVAALVWTAPLLGVCLIPAVLLLTPATRWYLHRAPAAYLRERAAYSRVNGMIQESVEAARTIEALGLGPARVGRVERAIGDWLQSERATLRLRTVYFPSCEASYLVPLVLSLGVGGVLHSAGLVSLGALTSATLYAQQLIDPVDVVMNWLDHLQLGGAALGRLLGVGQVPREAESDLEPQGERVEARRVHFSYRAGHDVLHGLDLGPEPGSRVAVVGRSGSGKSTLALLLAGVYGPRTGRVTVGGVDVHRLTSERVRAEVVLLTQEHHVFAGTLRDNLRLADQKAGDPRLREALAAVGASPWLEELGQGLDTEVGSGGLELTVAQAQQLALARLLLADPHTLVLDEATALLNPKAARQLERSVARVLEGRTVISVSHRLQSAVDADLVVVVEQGRVLEAGPHQELLQRGGAYARLWQAYRGGSTLEPEGEVPELVLPGADGTRGTAPASVDSEQTGI